MPINCARTAPGRWPHTVELFRSGAETVLSWTSAALFSPRSVPDFGHVKSDPAPSLMRLVGVLVLLGLPRVMSSPLHRYEIYDVSLAWLFGHDMRGRAASSVNRVNAGAMVRYLRPRSACVYPGKQPGWRATAALNALNPAFLSEPFGVGLVTIVRH